jgi:outer membrane receptor for monomeric catechols
MNVIGQEQRTGVLRYVRQRFPRVIRIFLGGGGHAVSKRSGTNGADYYLPGYAVADVFAAYKI